MPESELRISDCSLASAEAADNAPPGDTIGFVGEYGNAGRLDARGCRMTIG